MRYLFLILCIIACISCTDPAGIKDDFPPQVPVEDALVIRQASTLRSLNFGSKNSSTEDKPWRRATDYFGILKDDLDFMNESIKELISNYDEQTNWERALAVTNPPTMARGGGILFYTRDIETDKQIPVYYSDDYAYFETEPGKSYRTYFEIFLDGANGYEIDFAGLSQEFIATGNDEIAFMITNDYCAVQINGISIGSNTAWFPENPEPGYHGFHNIRGLNSEGRSAWRKRNFEEYGGYCYVAEFLMP